jgi:phage/plasmid-associated DNA primase
MELCEFRTYKYDDYIATTTGYDWREPTSEEMDTMYKLLNLIMPIKEERDAYLQILSTGLDGRCLEKFIIFNGCGGNGKGVIDDIMLLALGDYAMIGNNGILFETSKTGSNPEKANLHKKRFVVFREPSEKNKFENSTVKELTGGGSFSARGLYESKSNKELNLTMIIECNKRPLFKEEPGDAEVRRIIDILFRSSFVTDDNLVNTENNIYKANPIYKTREFQEKHKYALLKILMQEHSKYYKLNKSQFKLPQSIIDRSRQYLEMSCNIVEWFKDNYDETNDLTQYISIKDVYDLFKASEFYCNLSKSDKTKYTKKYISEYISSNIFFRRYYAERYNNIRSVIKGWVCKQQT